MQDLHTSTFYLANLMSIYYAWGIRNTVMDELDKAIIHKVQKRKDKQTNKQTNS